MKKRKTVNFNLLRPTLIEYAGRKTLNAKRYDLNIIIDYIKRQRKNFSIIYQNEELAIYSIKKENTDEGLYHIRIIKYRIFDVPNAYTRIESTSTDKIEEEELNVLLPDHDEQVIPLSDKSSIGETMSLLYDSIKNTLVVQSNAHCTSLKGITTLFDSIFNKYIEENPETIPSKTQEDSEFMLSLSVIPPQDVFERIDNLEYITEIEFIYEDNNMQDDVAGVLGVNNNLKAGKVQAKYYLDTANDKKGSLEKDYIKGVLGMFKKRRNNFRKLDLKGRYNEHSKIDIFELIGAKLFLSIHLRILRSSHI